MENNRRALSRLDSSYQGVLHRA